MKTLLVPLALCAACATPDYTWTRVSPPMATLTWEPTDPHSMAHFCGWDDSAIDVASACAIRVAETRQCFVYSVYTANEAKEIINGDGKSLYWHELNHCNGYNHVPEFLDRRFY